MKLQRKAPPAILVHQNGPVECTKQ